MSQELSTEATAAIGMTSSPEDSRRVVPLGLLLAGSVAVAAMLFWVVSVNRLEVQVLHQGIESTRMTAPAGDPAPIVISIAPPRRADGTEVFLDQVPVAHPEGDREGELLVSIKDLGPGIYELEVRVPRPTWRAAVRNVSIEIETAGQPRDS